MRALLRDFATILTLWALTAWPILRGTQVLAGWLQANGWAS